MTGFGCIATAVERTALYKIMSTGKSKEFEFSCTNGCEPYAGCPGHKMRAEFSRSMDIYSFFIDEKLAFCIDEDTWITMNKAADDIK